MEDLKQLLLKCQIYLQQGEWDKLLEALGSIKEEDIHNLNMETAVECYRILEHMIEKGEEIRSRIAENLVNMKKFKKGYGV